ncbi:Serine-pyruvate aminotransferase [Fusobacterium sp. DD29]|uniref:pyridoxal-phosphate-dependent aminotransferase family protein n=1 Tax=unclassified Fusobacterium TaxID=2648384 RepID=UPI001B8C1F08|nr:MULTISPECIES: aminotransferase class V-fold PLP-dependent enzyme [unclassified Fusobacterium]MBR8700689.1 Serine-pyruvate aminotransferase [Fusobacterium sp. DD45]MBR8710780.1 Serine-pyruvate aminotransferase [Fusobacterium sp. DD28]MBR8748911.1 Serine-pyruvate aminotransferase [Fusobacterium sp. DD29]MBR8751388.1 Serine-pyruvate aminotransferase [Fusobacterium sp. DD26]MBR8761187.1 Serine-pyruvate aminotransferase [Fusobacterium sp. DD25]
MLNLTVGPVQSNNIVRKIGSEQVPYFRTAEFSEIMKENERLMLEFSRAPKNSRAVFMTASGTGAMEASIINTLSDKDKVLVINGGSFGQRFIDILKLHEIPYDEIKLETGKKLVYNDLKKFEHKGYTAFLVNLHETSTGVYYDIEMISEFCKRNNLFLIVDSISSFLADEFNMSKLGVDIMITGSQKALACPPGISIIVLSTRALERIEKSKVKSFYFDLKSALKNGERGQTPFTPAVGILLQINGRLREIKLQGGVENEIKKVEALAKYFRQKIQAFPFEFVSESMSNAVTSLHPTTAKASDIFEILKDEYGIWICPNGGELKDKIFRVGHIGDLSIKDYDRLFEVFKDLQNRGII